MTDKPVTREQLACSGAAARAERERTRILRDADRRHARYLDEPEDDLVVLWSEPPGFDTALDDWPERVHGFDERDPCDLEWDRESARQRAERR